MTNLVANFAKAVDPAVKTVFNSTYKEAPRTSDKICNVVTAEDYITEIASNVGAGMAEYRAENASVNYQDYLAGLANNLTQYTYDRGVKISKKLMKWNKLGQIKSLVQQTALSIVKRREFDATKLLERGFLTTYTHSKDGSALIDLTGGDSVALFTASHATVRSSTAQSNRVTDGTTVNMDIAEDALEAAETVTFAAITDDNDEPITIMPDTLFVSRAKTWIAQRLLKSTGRVGTPNNDVNLVQGRYALVTLPYLDSSYAAYWFLQDSVLNKMEGFMMMLVGADAEHDGPYIDFDSKAIKHSWETELAAGHNQWQSFVGSKGTNAA